MRPWTRSWATSRCSPRPLSPLLPTRALRGAGSLPLLGRALAARHATGWHDGAAPLCLSVALSYADERIGA
eukprot:10559673-Lingulodinium_polyedra.AAC.1